MGGSASRPLENAEGLVIRLAANPAVQKIVNGTQPVPSDAEEWNTFLRLTALPIDASAEVLNRLVRQHVFQPLARCNIESGNFRALLIYYTRLLANFRYHALQGDITAARPAVGQSGTLSGDQEPNTRKGLPCELDNLVHFSRFFRSLVKVVCEEWSVVELLFHVESVPLQHDRVKPNPEARYPSEISPPLWPPFRTPETPSSQNPNNENGNPESTEGASTEDADANATADVMNQRRLVVMYRDRYAVTLTVPTEATCAEIKQPIQLPPGAAPDKPRVSDKEGDARFDVTTKLRQDVYSWIEKCFPQDYWVAKNRGFVFRDAQGHILTLRRLSEVICANQFTKLPIVIHLILLGLPQPISLAETSDDALPTEPSVLAAFVFEVVHFLVVTADRRCPLTRSEPFTVVHLHLLETLLCLFSLVLPKQITSGTVPVSDSSAPTIDADALPPTLRWPHLSEAAAHTAHQYFLNPARHPGPRKTLCPMATYADSLLPALPFVDALAEVLATHDVAQSSGLTPATFMAYLVRTSIGSLGNTTLPAFQGEATQCALTVLLLLVYAPPPVVRFVAASGGLTPIVPMQMNPFAEAFARLSDPYLFKSSAIVGAGKEETGSGSETFARTTSADDSRTDDISVTQPQVATRGVVLPPTVSYESLWGSLVSVNLGEHLCPLLLYAAVCKNRNFRLFCLARAEGERLVTPVLRLLYNLPSIATVAAAVDAAAGRVSSESTATDYGTDTGGQPAPTAATVLMLVLLILSRDRGFADSLHKAPAHDVEWLDQRHHLGDGPVSVGSIAILTILRVFSWNFGTYRDTFMHRAASAALSNITQAAEGLHWYVAEKLVDFASILMRQFSRRLTAAVSLCTDENGTPSSSAPRSPSKVLHEIDAIALVLQSVLSSMCGALRPPLLSRNVNLIYAVLRSFPEAGTTRLLEQLRQFDSVRDLEKPTAGGQATLPRVSLYEALAPYVDLLLDICCFFRVAVGADTENNDEGEETSVEEYNIRIAKAAAKIPPPTASDASADAVAATSQDNSTFSSVDQNTIPVEQRISLGYTRCGPGVAFDYTEVLESYNYFFPILWKTIYWLQPDHTCWSRSD
eukprot:GHVT01062383.1.p1 GENE.GHVT01062383.1~~GHVT01062383.1.p1  ORF type:complete len:1091 (+),score=98.02 GHVT01062383.1:558-3830(+)